MPDVDGFTTTEPEDERAPNRACLGCGRALPPEEAFIRLAYQRRLADPQRIEFYCLNCWMGYCEPFIDHHRADARVVITSHNTHLSPLVPEEAPILRNLSPPDSPPSATLGGGGACAPRLEANDAGDL